MSNKLLIRRPRVKIIRRGQHLTRGGQIGFKVVDGLVHLVFPQPTNYLEFKPEQAMGLAGQLRQWARHVLEQQPRALEPAPTAILSTGAPALAIKLLAPGAKNPSEGRIDWSVASGRVRITFTAPTTLLSFTPEQAISSAQVCEDMAMPLIGAAAIEAQRAKAVG